MTTLCKWLALGQGECQKFVPGERPRPGGPDMPISGCGAEDIGTSPSGGQWTAAATGHVRGRRARDMSTGRDAAARLLPSAEVLEVDVLAVVLVVRAGVVPVPVQHAGRRRRPAAMPATRKMMPPSAGGGVAVADGPGLVGGVLDVLAADRIDGGVEGVQEEDDDQQRDADDGDDGAGDQRRPGVAGEPLRARRPPSASCCAAPSSR